MKRLQIVVTNLNSFRFHRFTNVFQVYIDWTNHAWVIVEGGTVYKFGMKAYKLECLYVEETVKMEGL